jgi:chemotaxis protein methyltransferase CheR
MSPILAPAADPEFSFSAGDFERVRGLIRKHAGIHLHAGKQAMVYSRLSRRLRETGHRSFVEYLDWLESPQGIGVEKQEFINSLTTNLTAFFREEHHFDLLTEQLRNFKGSSLRIWCAAASTGEEPYSLAMTVAESLRAGVSAQIVASDIDSKVLATARRAVYATDSKGLSPERLRRHCQRGTGANDGRMRVKPDLARMIDFRQLNLVEGEWNLGEPFDIVFCRNVMIYFDAPTQRKVLERIHAVMKPHGHLFVGHSENFTDERHLFRLRGKTVYERV